MTTGFVPSPFWLELQICHQEMPLYKTNIIGENRQIQQINNYFAVIFTNVPSEITSPKLLVSTPTPPKITTANNTGTNGGGKSTNSPSGKSEVTASAFDVATDKPDINPLKATIGFVFCFGMANRDFSGTILVKASSSPKQAASCKLQSIKILTNNIQIKFLMVIKRFSIQL